MKQCASKILELAKEAKSVEEKNAFLTAASIVVNEKCCTRTEPCCMTCCEQCCMKKEEE